MSVREIVAVGDPVLREPARGVTPSELRSAEIQTLIDDLIETRRAADGAGLAANQVGVPVRIAVAEIEGVNPRYPYKPPIPLTVIVNPTIEPLDDEQFENNEGCLSVPGLRGSLMRHLAIRLRYLDRDGVSHDEVKQGLTAGTFQHEVDHLAGSCSSDGDSDPTSFSTWEQFERFHRDAFVEQIAALSERTGS